MLCKTRAPSTASWLLALLFACSCWAPLIPSRARADTYEWERTERLLRALNLKLAELPEGKRIAWVRVVRDEVFVDDELWPVWLNWFHFKTREDVVRRELLFAEGEPYQDARVEESMRNLRSMPIFALIRIVAVAVDDPGAVGVLVHTRDLWSLRLETGFNITTQIDQLLIRGTERNFVGRNKVVSADFTLAPMSYTLSQLYYARRVWGSALRLQESAGIIFNREEREPEGSLWALDFGQPYYNLKQRYAWILQLSYQNFVARRLERKRLRLYPDPDDDPDGPYAKRTWRQKDLIASLTGSIRIGERYKQAWTLGWDVRSRAVNPIRATELPPELEQAFRANALPRERLESGPTFSYDIFTPSYRTFENLTTFGQSENVRIGPSATLSMRVPLRAMGSTRNSWVFASDVGCVLALHGFLLDARVAGRTRYERQTLVDQRFDALLRGATPVLFGSFRLVARLGLEARRNDTALTYVTLGASNGLRGYTSQQIAGYGASRALANFELRTLPLEWQAVHVGGVLFYDVGTVYVKLHDAVLHHAAGVGLRVLFPQFNRRPFVLDGGMSFDPEFRFVPTIASEQVVPLTAAEDPD